MLNAKALSSMIILTAISVGALSAQGRREAAGFQVGTSFPDLTLPSLEDGRPSSLADFRGQKLLLHIFASW